LNFSIRDTTGQNFKLTHYRSLSRLAVSSVRMRIARSQITLISALPVSTTNPAPERVPFPKNPNGLITEQDPIKDAKRPAYASSEARPSVLAATV